MSIEVTWEAKPKSGITYIDLRDLGLSKKEWDALSKEEQRRKINDYLMETDQIRPIAESWL